MKTYIISIILSLMASLSAIMGEYTLNMFRQMPLEVKHPAREIVKPASEQAKPVRSVVKTSITKPQPKNKVRVGSSLCQVLSCPAPQKTLKKTSIKRNTNAHIEHQGFSSKG